eukprot:203232-Rhodomonas_salina.2
MECWNCILWNAGAAFRRMLAPSCCKAYAGPGGMHTAHGHHRDRVPRVNLKQQQPGRLSLCHWHNALNRSQHGSDLRTSLPSLRGRHPSPASKHHA